MEQEQTAGHKKSAIVVYVVIGIAIVLVIAVLMGGGSGSGSGGSISQPNPQSVAAADQSAASEAASANARVTSLAQIAAEQKVGLAQAKDQLRAVMIETRGQTEQARISAQSYAEVNKANTQGANQNYSVARIVQAILANLNFAGASPVQMYPAGGYVSAGGNYYGVLPAGTAGNAWSSYAP